MEKISENENVPETIIAQQIAEGVWGLEVDGELLEDRFKTAKDAVDFSREKYGLEAKARMLKKQVTKKGSKKKSAKKNDKSASTDDTEVPEEQRKNYVAKVHVDGDIRMTRVIRDKLALKPGDRWKFSILSVSDTEFTVKAVKVEG